MYLETDDKLDAVFAAQEAKYPIARPNRMKRTLRSKMRVRQRRALDFQTERSEIQNVALGDILIRPGDHSYLIAEVKSPHRSPREPLVFDAHVVFAASAEAIKSLDAAGMAYGDLTGYFSKITAEPPLSRELLVPALLSKARTIVFDASTVFRKIAATFASSDAVQAHAEAVSKWDRTSPPSQGTPLAPNKSAEPELPLRVEFVPSRQLLDIWTKSLNSFLEEAATLDEAAPAELFSIAQDKRRLEREFHKRLRAVLVKQAVIYSYSRKVYHLTVAHAFSSTFMVKIGEEFLIRGDLGTPFYQLLFDELSAWVRSGRKISGSWGHLALNTDGDLVFYLQKSAVRKVPGFTALTNDATPKHGEI